MKRHGRAKGPRMVEEILRLCKQGLSKRSNAKALDISRNTVDKYLDEVLKPEPAQYHAPWFELIEWKDTWNCTQGGQSLRDR